MPPDDAITCEAIGAVRLIRVGASPHGILSGVGARSLLAAFETAVADPETCVIVFAGLVPGVFVRHYDLRAIGKAAEALRAGTIAVESFLDAEFARLTDLVAAADLPVIAAIDGICMGGGFELALACDIRIAQHDVAHIGLPEIRVDILPGGGGTIRLARLIGESAALDIALRGRTVDAARALRLGIVGDVVDDAVAGALEIATALAARDRAALAAIKRLVRSAHDRPLAEALRDERLAFAAHIADSDAAMRTMATTLAAGTMLEDMPGAEIAAARLNDEEREP